MAKSPTPIPAPPVKIHRGAPGSAPARQRRRRKKVNPFVLFLCGLARRLYFGIKTAFKFLLFVPVLVFMVAFSYNVDRSGLFQGALAPRLHAWRFCHHMLRHCSAGYRRIYLYSTDH